MSARKSWDVQPSARRGAPAEPVAAPRSARVPRVRAIRKNREEIAAPVKPKALGTERRALRTNAAPLKERRREERTRTRIALVAIVFVLVGGALYMLWQPALRIHEVQVIGPEAEGTKSYAMETISGTYAYVLPKNSVFFFPKNAIRHAILSAYPNIDAVAITRSSFTSIAVKNVPRASAFVWCGPALHTATASSTSAVPPCYDADATGFIFGTSTGDAFATTTPILRIYAPIDSGDISPLRAHVLSVGQIPATLLFIKTLKTLDVSVVSLVIHGDEADLYTPEGVRITYVLGKEEQAAELAKSSFNALNVHDPLLEYVDLRFDGKVYTKKRGDLNA